jgi:acetyl esterase/lipase
MSLYSTQQTMGKSCSAEKILLRHYSLLLMLPDRRPSHLPSGCDLEFSVMQHSLPRGDLPQSDIGCLNLNITTPHSENKPSGLPVFVFIHGGGYEIGASSWQQFNLAWFVKLSVEMGLPVVAVSIK